MLLFAYLLTLYYLFITEDTQGTIFAA